MRLINVATEALEEFFGDSIPPYAILSHCWGKDEVSFQDINAPRWKGRQGYAKINYGILQSIKDDLKYIWVDTCCIDKTSSAELSEAINSMYQWYAKSEVCYAYLEDVQGDSSNGQGEESTFGKSRWFTRGWTLQELLAPDGVKFFGQQWTYLGSKRDLSKTISKVTKIPQNFLDSSKEISCQSIAKRMSWASERQTTRVEDTAYCLLGIFKINMPLLYGEGERAFQRLQEELIKESDDQTIFAWDTDPYTDTHYGVFAPSPAHFRRSSEVVPIPSSAEMPYTMTNKGLHIELPLLPISRGLYMGVLDCHNALDFSGRIGIPLLGSDDTSINWFFIRTPKTRPKICSVSDFAGATVRKIYIQKRLLDEVSKPIRYICRLEVQQLTQDGYKLTDVTPSDYPYNWASSTMAVVLDPQDQWSQTQHTYRAAFEFRNEVTDFQTSLVVAVTINPTWPEDGTETASAAFFHKQKRTPLKQWYQQFKEEQFGEGYSKTEYFTSDEVGKVEMELNVESYWVEMFRRSIFLIHVKRVNGLESMRNSLEVDYDIENDNTERGSYEIIDGSSKY